MSNENDVSPNAGSPNAGSPNAGSTSAGPPSGGLAAGVRLPPVCASETDPLIGPPSPASQPASPPVVSHDPAELGFDPDRLALIGRHLRRYVDRSLFPCTYVCVSRGGKPAYVDLYGERDCERELPVTPDTVFRIYSMTKPITSIALMQLYEQGLFQLKDPISRWIPGFAEARVFTGGNAANPTTREPATEITVHHLLTHTSGLTYDFHFASPVDELYRLRGFNWGPPGDLASTCDLLAELPLLFEPGTEWNYSYSTDVAGRLVELISGMTLADYFDAYIFAPLGMSDTGFQVNPDAVERFASNYMPKPPTLERALLDDAQTSPFVAAPKILSGGGGLVSTMADYCRFTQMLAAGGTLDGQRIIGKRTLAFMTANHLPGGADLTEVGRKLFAEAAFDGVGFGLGFSVVIDPAKSQVLCEAGEFAWGGAASTAFFVDPANEIEVIFMTQLLPSSTHPVRPELKGLIYQAML